MARISPRNPLRRSGSSKALFLKPGAGEAQPSPNETIPLLQKWPTGNTASAGENTWNSSWLRRILTHGLGREQTIAFGPEDSPKNQSYYHGLYKQFPSIDWMRDAVSDSLKRAKIKNRKGFVGCLWARIHGIQGWMLVAMVGVLTALVAYFIDVTEASLFDFKFGHCSGNWRATRMQCCSRATTCANWMSWGQHASSRKEVQQSLDFVLYVLFMLAMTLVSCSLVLADKRVIPPPRPSIHSTKQESEVHVAAYAEQHETILYPSAGSGVTEVKVISSGFIIHGFLGMRTLFLKSLACILSVAAGLSIGKEGPYVHIAACIGNVMSRLFPSYDKNAGKRIEVISASSAAGVAVAFGAPISGVIFSLEEVSYSFPPKTLFRTFFCSIIAAVSLRVLNPYLNGRIVPFEVEYHCNWRAYEMPVFVFLGVLGGAVGALFVKAARLWSTRFRICLRADEWPILEAISIALVTGAISFWNKYSSLSIAQLMFELASDCSNSEIGTRLCPTTQDIPHLIGDLGVAFLIKFFLTVISFGLKVPAGVYVPTMVVGGLLGRAFGHALQYTIISARQSDVLYNCSMDQHLEGCIVPGVYALITAGATMAGATRLSLTLALMLFEISGSLNYVLPFSVAVLVAKWTANAIEPESIYDLYLSVKGYPFLDEKSRPSSPGKLGEITPSPSPGCIIDMSDSPLVPTKDLIDKLDFMIETGQFDGGLPIIKDHILVGIISCLDLALCVDRLRDSDCKLCLVFPHERRRDSGEELDFTANDAELADISQQVDPAPLTLDILSPLEVVYECFAKLGVRYICAMRDGRFVGLVQKKEFVKFARAQSKIDDL